MSTKNIWVQVWSSEFGICKQDHPGLDTDSVQPSYLLGYMDLLLPTSVIEVFGANGAFDSDNHYCIKFM